MAALAEFELVVLIFIEPEAVTICATVDSQISVGDFLHPVAALGALVGVNIGIVFHLGSAAVAD
jgi:hypothetical protein